MTVAELEVIVRGNNSGLKKTLDDSKSDVKNAAGKMSDDVEASSKAIRASMMNAFKGVGRVASQAGLALSVAVTAPIVKAVKDTVKEFGEFDEQLRNVDSLAKLTAEQFDELKKSVLSLAEDRQIKQAPEDLASGLYDIYSSGKSGTEALDILKVSAYGASAGITDTATSSRVLMAVLNSGIGGVHSAREAMDVLFKEVDLGVNSFSDLANQIGDVLPTAKTAGISLQEVAGAMAVLTRHGISAAESSTALNNLLLHIIKPAKDAQKAMKEAGIEFGLSALKSKGLSGWIADATEKLHGNKQKLIEILPEIRGLKALLVLADGGGREYTDMLVQMATATEGVGATQKALERQTKGQKFGWAELTKEIKIAEIEFGDVLAPVLHDVVEAVRGVVTWLKNMDEPTKKVVLGVAATAAAVGPLLLGLGGLISMAANVITAFEAVSGVFVGLGGATGVLAGAVELLSGPIGWVIAAVTALAAAWYNNWGGIREFTQKIVSTIVGFFQENWPLIQKAAANVWNGIKEAFAPLVPYFVKSWEWLKMVTSTIWSNIKIGILQSLTNILGLFKAFIQFLTGDWSGAWSTMKQILMSSFLSMEAQVAASAAAILRTVKGMFNGVSTAYHEMKHMFDGTIFNPGGHDDGSGPAQFTGLDGMINSLDAVSKGAKAASSNMQGLITGRGVMKGSRPKAPKGGIDAWNPFEDTDLSGVNSGGGEVDKDVESTTKKSKAMSALDEQAKELRKTIADLRKEIALEGDSTKSASMAYDLKTGVIKKSNEALGQEALALMKKLELQDKERASSAALKAIYTDLTKSTEAMNRATDAEQATNEADRLSIEKFGKAYADLTDEKNKAAIADALRAKLRKEEQASITAANEWAKTTLENLKEEFVLRDKTTRVEKLQIELQKERYRSLSELQKKALIESAKALDDADGHDKAVKATEKLREAWVKVYEAVAKAWAEQREGADERFSSSMLKLAERAANLGTETQATNYQLRQLAEQFGVGATQADKIADGMSKAKEYMTKLFEINELEKYVEMIGKLADGFSKTIMDSLGALVTGGFKPFFSTLVSGFRSTIAEMAQDWLKSQIRHMLMNLGTKFLGGLFGGGGGGLGDGASSGGAGQGVVSGFAVGGMVPKGDLFRMNEAGRDELFIAPNGGTVVPASLSREMAKSGLGGSTTIVMNISTPDAGSFRESEEQIIARLDAAIQRRRRRA